MNHNRNQLYGANHLDFPTATGGGPTTTPHANLQPGQLFPPIPFPLPNMPPLTIGGDMNSPELFKHNIEIALTEHLPRIQALASNVLSGIEHAYHPSTNPSQTENDLIALKQALDLFYDFLRDTGVGALALEIPAEGSTAPTDQQMFDKVTLSFMALYDQIRGTQESGSVVAGLLMTTEGRR